MRSFYIIILISLAINPCFGQESAVISELNLADRLISVKKYDEALVHVEKALKIDKLHLEALEKKVTIMLLDGKEKEVLKEIDEMIFESPQQAEYYYLRAVVNVYRQKPNKAIDDYENAIYYQMPEKYMSKIYLNMGVAYYQIGDFELTEVEYKNALDLDPKFGAVYHNWGMMKYEQRLYEDAIDYFKKALQYGVDTPVLYYNLGMAYFRIKDNENACLNFGRSCTQGGYSSACKILMLECGE